MQALPKPTMFPAEQALFDTLWRTAHQDSPTADHEVPQSVTRESDDPEHKRYRAIFISDLHLGTPGCQAQALLSFIKANASD